MINFNIVDDIGTFFNIRSATVVQFNNFPHYKTKISFELFICDDISCIFSQINIIIIIINNNIIIISTII